MKIKLTRKEIRLNAVSIIFGLVIGWMFFYNGNISNSHNHEVVQDSETIWTCSMHPQIKLSEPGLCPICAMDLIPLSSNTSAEEYDIQISESVKQLANIQTTIVKNRIPQKSIQLFGTVQFDERNISQITARFNGRIEDLNINFTGQHVKKGQVLGNVYSPDLISAQQELLQAFKSKASNPEFYISVRNKLKLWNLSDNQINEIESSGRPKNVMRINSPINGIVIRKNISIGDYVKEGSVLFEVTDLSNVWIQFQAYEEDLQGININDEIEFTINSLPGKKYQGKVKFVDPWVDEDSRVANIRVELENPNQKLKPGMYANGILSSLSQSNSAKLIIPKSAVLWTGKRSVVFVQKPEIDEPSFAYREIILGPLTDEGYIVAEGLNEGEEIVTNGVFKVDAASQLIGNASMMNPRNEIFYTGMQSNLQIESFLVFGNCSMCEERIETAVKSLPGIKKADWNKDSKLIEVIYNPEKINVADVHKKIAAIGHDTELEKASQEVYNELPGCCEYRN